MRSQLRAAAVTETCHQVVLAWDGSVHDAHPQV